MQPGEKVPAEADGNRKYSTAREVIEALGSDFRKKNEIPRGRLLVEACSGAGEIHRHHDRQHQRRKLRTQTPSPHGDREADAEHCDHRAAGSVHGKNRGEFLTYARVELNPFGDVIDGKPARSRDSPRDQHTHRTDRGKNAPSSAFGEPVRSAPGKQRRRNVDDIQHLGRRAERAGERQFMQQVPQPTGRSQC